MQKLSFTKMNGAGNDFVVLDNRSGDLQLDGARIAALCDRHRGIGADGVLLVEAALREAADFRMRYYNADGGEAEMCGNGARCFARYASRLLPTPSSTENEISFETLAGLIRARMEGETVHLQMSKPTDGLETGALKIDGGADLNSSYFLNTGVPHVVVPVENVAAFDVHAIGRSIRYHERFAPKGTNANFMQSVNPAEIILRTYERGVEAETLACGTGATASALIHAEINDIRGQGKIAVHVKSGDTLQIGFVRSGRFEFSEVTLGGPADFVFSGEIAG